MVSSDNHYHIAPYRAWACLHLDGDLTTTEHEHISKCQPCLKVFQLCLTAETFGGLLVDLRLKFGEEDST